MKFPFQKEQKAFQKISYSQCGEDLIMAYLFQVLKIEKPDYWDIGAYQPYSINNTALFYERGCRGINVEPNPDFINLFRKQRPGDINLNVGVSHVSGSGDYYVMDVPSLNTFSREHADEYTREGHTLKNKIRLDLLTLPEISKQFYQGKWPDLLTIDVEGLDFEILSSMDFSDKLTVICIETISYSTAGKGEKNERIMQFMRDKDYFLYADTYINSIFVKRKSWQR